MLSYSHTRRDCYEARENYRSENHPGPGAGRGIRRRGWKGVYQYAFALAHGAGEGLFYYGDWIRKPGVAICSCNDGLRPVIFKLEATDEESPLSYTPVQ